MRRFLASMYDMNRSENDGSSRRSRSIALFSTMSTVASVVAVAVPIRID